MRLAALLAVSVAVSSCAGMKQARQDRLERQSARMEAEYGPRCAAVNPPGTPGYRACLGGYADAERRAEPPAAPLFAQPKTTTCTPDGGGGMRCVER